MKRIFLLAIVASLGLTSCAVKKARTAKSLNIYGRGVMHIPVVADLDVKQKKVTGVAESKSKSITVAILKIEAIANAIEESNADLLVEPSYEVIKKGSNTTVTVKGWPAYYKNFRSIKKADIELLKVGKGTIQIVKTAEK